MDTWCFTTVALLAACAVSQTLLGYGDDPPLVLGSLQGLTQIHPMVRPMYELISGFDAGILEANDQEGGIAGRKIKAVMYDDRLGFNRELILSSLDKMINVDNISLFVYTGFASAAMVTNLSITHNIPMLFTESITEEAGVETVQFRPPYTSEGYLGVHYLLNGLTCKRLMLVSTVFTKGNERQVEAFAGPFRRIGFPTRVHYVPSAGDVKYKGWQRRLIDDFYSASSQCMFVTLTQFELEAFFRAVQEDDRYDPEDPPRMVSPSYSTGQRWVNPIAGKGLGVFRNVFFTQLVPSPSRTSSMLVRRYRAANDRFRESGLDRFSDTVAETGHTYRGLQGYASARVLIEALRRVRGPFTADNIRSAVYQSQLFRIDDATFGPYSDECVGDQQPDVAPCQCNVGIRRYYVARVNTTTGELEEVPDRGAQRGAASIAIPPTKCLLDSTVVRQSLVFAAPSVAGRDGAGGLAQHTAVVEAMRNATLSPTGAMIHLVETDERPAFGAAQIAAAAGRFRLLGVAAPRADPAPLAASAGQKLVIAPLRRRLAERDAPTPPAGRWYRHVVPFWPTLADFTLAAAWFADDRGHSAAVHVLADTETVAADAARALETFGSVPASSAVLAGGPLPALPTSGALIAATQDDDTLRRVIAHAAQAPGLLVILATSEFTVFEALPADAARNVLFVSALRHWRSGSGEVSPDPAVHYGWVVGGVLRSIASRLSPQPTAREVVDQLYKSGYLDAAGTSAVVGPFYPAPCGNSGDEYPHPGGTCQCAKGLTSFFIRRADVWGALKAGATLSGNLTDDPVADVPRFGDCGVKYAMPRVLGAAALLGIGCGATSFLASAAVVVFCVYSRRGRRDHGHAPKDAMKPFAIAFTDIQASTALWARCPQEMGPALDDHHAIMRRLVAKHAGYEVKTIGDSFMVAFGTARAAVEFGLGVQEAFFAHDWVTSVFDDTYHDLVTEAYPDLVHTRGLWSGIRVRVGIHFGEGDVRVDDVTKGYDYYGTVVNTAARVEGVAHGGQVLITRAAMEAATNGFAEQLPGDAATTIDLGPQPLRGLDEPVSLFQVLPPAMAGRRFPPLRLNVAVDEDAECGDTVSEGSAVPCVHAEGSAFAASASGDAAQDGSVAAIARTLARQWASNTPADRVSTAMISSISQNLLIHRRGVLGLLSPASPKARRAILAEVARHWRVSPDRASPAVQRAARGVAPEDVSLLLCLERVCTIEGFVSSSVRSERRASRRSLGWSQSAPISAASYFAASK